MAASSAKVKTADLEATEQALRAELADLVEKRILEEPLEPWAPITKGDIRAQLHATLAAYRKNLGGEYDLDVATIMLATAAVEKLDGDPAWLLIVGGSGSAKTETGMPLKGAGARIVSTIASEGALLSATSKGERTKEATGGLLREMGERGMIFIKDFTSIMSMNSNTRDPVLGALREIYDEYWTRDVGTDGGRKLTWKGRLIVIGAVTTAWDAAHGVVAKMGDRFVLVRIDSRNGRLSAGRQALANVGGEAAMRSQLAEAVGDLLGIVDSAHPPTLKRKETEAILAAANVVTQARTGVEHDYQGNPISAHDPESPTRFAKQLGQIMRGAIAIGVRRKKALKLAIRCARDSMNPLRLAVLEDVAAHPLAPTADVVKRLQKPRSTIDRALQDLHLLDLLVVEAVPNTTRWFYSLAPGVDLDAIALEPSNPFATTH